MSAEYVKSAPGGGGGGTPGADFVVELKAGLQAWLRKLLRDPSLATHAGLYQFFEASDAAGRILPSYDRATPVPAPVVEAGADAASLPPAASDMSSSAASAGGGGLAGQVGLDDFVLLKVRLAR